MQTIKIGSSGRHFSIFVIIAGFASLSKSGQQRAAAAAACGQMVVVSGPAVPSMPCFSGICGSSAILIHNVARNT